AYRVASPVKIGLRYSSEHEERCFSVSFLISYSGTTQCVYYVDGAGKAAFRSALASSWLWPPALSPALSAPALATHSAQLLDTLWVIQHCCLLRCSVCVYGCHAAPAVAPYAAAPVVAAAPTVTKVVTAYAAAPAVTAVHAAPAVTRVATTRTSAPIATAVHAAPAFATYASAPSVTKVATSYAAAPVVAAAPAVTRVDTTYAAAPVATAVAAPAVTAVHAAPAVATYAAAPVLSAAPAVTRLPPPTLLLQSPPLSLLQP
ncbi:hypothetical protein V5799_003895, partial [Amblyomma americanum]